jgi:malate permease and related proteins
MVLRKLSVFDDYAADVLFRLVHQLTLPALLLSVLPNVVISRTMFLLPLISTLVILATIASATLAGKAYGMNNNSLAVLVSGSSIMNLGFVMPFIQSFYGDDGLARLFLFGIPNGLSACAIATTFSGREFWVYKKKLAIKLMVSPPLLTLIAALLMNAFGLHPAPIAVAVLHSIGGLTIPLILLGLGASLRIAKVTPFHLAAAIILRMLLGLALGVWLANLFHLEGLDRAITVLSASAPAGFDIIRLASIEKLDREYAATFAASCMIASMLLVPILLTIF